MPDRPAIIHDLIDTRKAWGMSRADLAELMPCTESHLEKLEDGRATPSFRMLTRWADAMGYDLALKQRA